MTNALYYPRYFPDALHSRVYPLFCESLSVMIPYEDLLRFEKANEDPYLRDALDSSIFRTFDASFLNTRWHHEKEIDFLNCILETLEKSELFSDIESIRSAPRATQHLAHPFNEYECLNVLSIETARSFKRRGWHVLAAQKLPENFLDILSRTSLLIPVVGHIFEADPILVPRHIGSFIISNLSREFASQNRLIAITDEDEAAISSSVVLGSPTQPSPTRQLVSCVLELIFPKDLESVSFEQMLEFRESTSKLRTNFLHYMNHLQGDHPYDTELDAQRLSVLILEIQSEIQGRLDEAFEAHARENRQSLAIDVFSGLVGSLVGGGSDVMAKIFGGSLTPLTQRVTRTFTQPEIPATGEAYRDLALFRSFFQGKSKQPGYSLPGYLATGL